MAAIVAPARRGGPLALHDLRVACRRLETALRLWARGAPARAARRRAQAMRRAAGSAREHEVLREMLRARRLGAAVLPPVLRRAWLARLARGGSMQRAGALPSARAVAGLGSKVERVARSLAHADQVELRALARLRLWRADGRAELAHALASGEAQALHRARLRLKRWRYAEEERSAAWPARARAASPIPALRRWQTALGRMSDRDLLIELAARSGPAGLALVPRLEALRRAALAGLRRRSDAIVSPPPARSPRA